MARNHLNSEEAEAYINKMDKRRGAYINYYTAYAWGNPQYYDIWIILRAISTASHRRRLRLLK